MPYIQIMGLASGEPSQIDGDYLVEYDPARPGGRDRYGNETICHLITTPDITKATEYTLEEAFELYKRPHGMRADGKPNRPLTAFNVVIY